MILVRTDLAVEVLERAVGHYSNAVSRVPTLRRARSSSRAAGPRSTCPCWRIPAIRFFNTHLESFDALARAGQAQELMALPAMNTNKAEILVGDLNSDPAAASPDSRAYNAIAAAGFKETGNTANTCCHNELLTNSTATFTERIDHILTRPGLDGFVNAHVIGNDPSLRVELGGTPAA